MFLRDWSHSSRSIHFGTGDVDKSRDACLSSFIQERERRRRVDLMIFNRCVNGMTHTETCQMEHHLCPPQKRYHGTLIADISHHELQIMAGYVVEVLASAVYQVVDSSNL